MLLTLVLACATAPEPGTAPPPQVAPPEPAPPVILDATTGDPGLQSADRLAFGPDGHLAVGDGDRDRVYVFATGETAWDGAAAEVGSVADLAGEAAATLGIDAAAVRVTDIAVNPASGRTWVAVERQDEAWAGVLAVTAEGGLSWVDLAALEWVRVRYPRVDGAGSIVSDLEWTEHWLVLAVTEEVWTASQVVTVPVPVAHGSDTAVTSTHTYHRTHNAWETLAPITSLFSWSDGETDFIGASYQCAPVVRFDVEDLAAGEEETVGTTPYDYGPLRQVLDFAVVGEGDGAEVLASVSNLGGTAVQMRVFERDRRVDEDADILFSFGGDPVLDKVDNAPALDDAVRIEPVGDGRVVVFDGVGLDTVTP